jgi:Rrf2 family protein
MLRLSRKTVLSLEAVLDIAYNARPEPVQSRDITERQGIPNRYLEQVLQRLVRAGVLKGVRGPRGGYTLARERRRISVGDVLRVVSAMDVEEDEHASAALLGEKVIDPLWEQVISEILARFDGISMEDLCQEASAKGIPRADGSLPDYTI